MTNDTAAYKLDLAAWCGEAWDLLTPEDQETFVKAAVDIDNRLENPDERDIARFATLNYLLGELTVDDAGARRAATKAAMRAAFLEAQQVGVLAVELDRESEVQVAQRLCIDRMTLRKARGVRKEYERKKKKG